MIFTIRAHILEAHYELYEEVMNMYQSGLHLEFVDQAIELATRADRRRAEVLGKGCDQGRD
ncbi:MAG TPA: hypothetical protein VMW80_12445 [Candidatus Dormibacteraeota bacterium]|nr:hypothetical protein [Candidatus Dormibacteraeota bacterium]